MIHDPAERATVVSMLTTTAMGTIEVLAGALFGSVAFVAAGMDALSDTATSAAVYGGLLVSKRPADRGHPYGHRQAETIALLLLAVALVAAGGRIAYLAAGRLLRGGEVEATLELFILACASIPVFTALASYKIAVGKRTGNPSVEADGYHTLSDSVSVIAVLVGLAFVRLGYPIADPLVALGISALVAWWGVSLGRRALNIIMEASPGEVVISEIRKVCQSVPGVKGCHRCRARKVGSKIFADLHVLVDPEVSMDDAHVIATKVERRLRARVRGLESVVVHLEPAKVAKRDKLEGKT
ncbi:MAG: cation diffusion facilitator family transporter [Candidatus Hadarchaeales archaeon]